MQPQPASAQRSSRHCRYRYISIIIINISRLPVTVSTSFLETRTRPSLQIDSNSWDRERKGVGQFCQKRLVMKCRLGANTQSRSIDSEWIAWQPHRSRPSYMQPSLLPRLRQMAHDSVNSKMSVTHLTHFPTQLGSNWLCFGYALCQSLGSRHFSNVMCS